MNQYKMRIGRWNSVNTRTAERQKESQSGGNSGSFPIPRPSQNWPVSTQSNTNTSVTVHQRGNIQKTYTTHMQSRDTGGRCDDEAAAWSLWRRGLNGTFYLSLNSQEVSSRENDAVPSFLFLFLYRKYTNILQGNVFTSLFGSKIRKSLRNRTSCRLSPAE